MNKSAENSIRLRPMSDAEYQLWLPQQIESFAESKVKSGNWAPEESLGLATKQMAELLPEGVATKDHLIFAVEVECGVVGTVWVNIKKSALGTSAFIYNIEIEPNYRSQRYGTKALQLLEERLRRDGVTSLALHVFGYNVRAQALYAKLGFEVTNVNMAKKIAKA